MAHQKEAIVLIVDVGESMTQRSVMLEASIKAVTLLVQQKILHGAKDDIGLVLFGTEETHNDLGEDGYNNIEVRREITPPDLELLKIIEKITPGGQKADFVDALVVAMDMLQKKVGDRNHSKRVFLVTDAGCVVNKQDLDKIIEQFTSMEAKLNVIGVDFADGDSSQEAKQERFEVKAQNEELLVSICEKSVFSSRSVVQKSNFRGFFELSPLVKIPVWTYTKTSEAKFPSLKKYSKVATENPNAQVAMERTRHTYENPDDNVEETDVSKAYRYGRTLVPFSKIDETALKFSSESCLKLIGFCAHSKIPRYHYMANVECVGPLPGDESAATALAAVAQAMHEAKSVAIVRYVKRANSAPQLGCLTPHLKDSYAVLYFNKLPFAEDLRQYSFAPLLDAKRAHAPNQQQLDAAEDLINSLDLMESGVDSFGQPMEALKPKLCYNPALQHFYESVQSRALRPEDPLPKLSETIQKYVNPDDILLEKAKAPLEAFKDCFPLAKTESKEKQTKKRFWSEAFDAAGDIRLDSYVGDDAKRQKKDDGAAESMSLQSLLSGNVDEVGTVSPVEDFNSMLKRKDQDLVETAIDQMKRRIVGLVNDSIKDSHYPKALECLVALRLGCIEQQESEHFNKFLVDVKKFYRGKRRNDFWLRVVAEKISLITSDEDDQSDITDEEATAFLETDAVPTNLESEILDQDADEDAMVQDEPKDGEPDAESLFDKME